MDILEFIPKDDYTIVKRKTSYFRLGNKEADILQDISNGIDNEIIAQKYTITTDELNKFKDILQQIGILGAKKKEKKNILFLKFSIFNPDKIFSFIVNTFAKSKIINKILFYLFNLFIVIGIGLTILSGGNIFNQFLRGFTIIDYFWFYLITITAVLFHEFGHAFACKYYGGKVEEIGFYLIFFSPALYCDVSGIWAFNERRKRLVTLFAGIYVQLLILASSIILYYFLVPASTFLATFIAWNILMILSNIIPVIKLDGYWILSNYFDIPNLYEKALRLALGDSEKILFNDHERSMKKFIKYFGILNISFVFISLLFGSVSIYFISKRLEGFLMYASVTIDSILYILTFIFFSIFLIKLFKKKKEMKGHSEHP